MVSENSKHGRLVETLGPSPGFTCVSLLGLLDLGETLGPSRAFHRASLHAANYH
jgi:hypothetical protein